MNRHEPEPSAVEAVARLDALAIRFGAVVEDIERVVVGQTEVVEQVIITLLAGGHALLVGLPGLAKTRLVNTVGTALGMDTKRVQFTPDLVPSDILGAEVLETGADGSRMFRFIEGPVFAQLLMADEINRASPRTQSALLEAMQERQAPREACRAPSMCWQRKTPSSRTAPTRCQRHSWTAFCCRSMSASLPRRMNAAC